MSVIGIWISIDGFGGLYGQELRVCEVMVGASVRWGLGLHIPNLGLYAVNLIST